MQLRRRLHRVLIQIVLTMAMAVSLGMVEAYAQTSIDPSSALLLNRRTDIKTSTRNDNSSSQATDTRLESSRYTVRPRTEKSPARRSSDPPEASKTPSTTPATTSTVPTATTVVIPPAENGAVVLGPESVPTEEVPESVPEQSVPEASRHLLDISVASTYLYENSESGYSYRQLTMASPAFVVKGNLWLSPEFSIGGTHMSSLGGQVMDQTSALGATRTETAFGLFLKKTFAQSALVVGAEMFESQFKIANESVSKLKTKSTGVRVSFEGEFRSSTLPASSSWLIGFSAAPKMQHQENSAATEVRSGTGVNAYGLGVSVERRWSFDSTNAMFVRLEHRVERDLFTGSATLPDPVGGATPSGVAVTTGTTLIQFGYAWGE